jgi:hypothetical protein
LQMRSENTPPQAFGRDSTMPLKPPTTPPTIDESVRSTAWQATTPGAMAGPIARQLRARKVERVVMSRKRNEVSSSSSKSLGDLNRIFTKSFARNVRADFDLDRFLLAENLKTRRVMSRVRADSALAELGIARAEVWFR